MVYDYWSDKTFEGVNMATCDGYFLIFADLL